jgi:hypothetical protein
MTRFETVTAFREQLRACCAPESRHDGYQYLYTVTLEEEHGKCTVIW